LLFPERREGLSKPGADRKVKKGSYPSMPKKDS